MRFSFVGFLRDLTAEDLTGRSPVGDAYMLSEVC